MKKVNIYFYPKDIFVLVISNNTPKTMTRQQKSFEENKNQNYLKQVGLQKGCKKYDLGLIQRIICGEK